MMKVISIHDDRPLSKAWNNYLDSGNKIFFEATIEGSKFTVPAYRMTVLYSSNRLSFDFSGKEENILRFIMEWS